MRGNSPTAGVSHSCLILTGGWLRGAGLLAMTLHRVTHKASNENVGFGSKQVAWSQDGLPYDKPGGKELLDKDALRLPDASC